MPRQRPAEELSVELGAQLRRLREKLGLSIEQVANEAGINAKQYQLLETGLSNRYPPTSANPTIGQLIAVGRVFRERMPSLRLDVAFGADEEVTFSFSTD